MYIVSALSGRIRLRFSKRDRAVLMLALKEEIESIPGVLSVVDDRRTGSLLCYYSTVLLADDDMKKRIFKRYSELKYPLSLRFHTSQLKFQNPLLIKKTKMLSTVMHSGMTLSLMTVLTSAVYWNKRVHVGSGILLSSFIGYHILVSRKTYIPLVQDSFRKLYPRTVI
jgi:hypothetical protein